MSNWLVYFVFSFFCVCIFLSVLGGEINHFSRERERGERERGEREEKERGRERGERERGERERERERGERKRERERERERERRERRERERGERERGEREEKEREREREREPRHPQRRLPPRQEQEKRRKYGQRVRELEHASFVPLVFTCTGGAGPAATTFLKRLADQISSTHQLSYNEAIVWLRTRLSFALLRSSLMCIRGSRPHRSRRVDFNAVSAAISETKI